MDALFVRDRIRGVNDEAPARQPPTRSPSRHRATVDVAACEMRAVQGMRARRGVVDARVRSCHGVLGAHRSKERLYEHAGRDRAGVIVVRRLQGESAIPRLTGVFTNLALHRGGAV